MGISGSRAMSRAVALAVAIAVAVPMLGTPSASAASTFTVDSTADQTDATLDGVCATAGGACTLRAAVQEANDTTGATIVVPAGAYGLAPGSSDTTGDLDLRKPMTIRGAGSTTVDGGGTERVVEVFGTGTTIDGIVLTNGSSTGSGGAVRVNSGAKLTLVASTVSNSVGRSGGGISNSGSLTLDATTVSGNTASTTGGGVNSSGSLTTRNSTISGNYAAVGGGMKVGSKTVLSASTVTANTARSSGGGISSSSSKAKVEASVIAGNAARSGPDCRGRLSVSAPTHIGITTRCITTGTAPSTGNAQLGPLADNGGPTLTHLPSASSPLVDALSTAACLAIVTVDQRGIARPYGAGCDIGAVEVGPVAPFTLDVALAASPEDVGAGIGTIPAENIPPDLLVDVTRASSELGATALSRFALSRFALSRFPIEDSALSRFALSRFALSRFALSRFLLSDVPVDGGWEAVLAPDFAPDPVPPLQTLTLADVIELPSVQALTLGQADLGATGLGEIPVADFAFDGLDLERIPPTDDPGLQDPSADLDDERLAAWCDMLGDEACERAGIDPDPTDATPPDPTTSDSTMLAVSLNGASLDSTALSRFALSRFALSRFALSRFAVYDTALSRFTVEDMALSRFELADLDLDAIDIDASALSRFALSRFALSRFGGALDTIVDCSKVDCDDAGTTLGEAAEADALVGTVGDLILAIVNEDITELDGLTFMDLFPGLFADLTYLPWESLDLAAAQLQNDANPLEPAATFTATIAVGGNSSADVDVALTLPSGFLLVPGSARFDGEGIDDPSDAIGTLQFAFDDVAPGSHTLGVQARAGLELGEFTAHVDATAAAGAAQLTAGADAPIRVVESFEPPGNGGVKTLANDVLYVAHVNSSQDEDVYEFEVTEEGTRVSLLLSGLTADYDLVLQGPPTVSLRGRPTQELRPVEDNGIGLDARDEQAAPDVQYDVVIDPALGATYSIAASRGVDPEEVRTGVLPLGTYTATVRGYNGVFSPEAYVLQMRTTVESLPVATPRVFPFENEVAGHVGDVPGVPSAAGTPADLNTVVLTAPRRMIGTYGWARTEPVLDAAAAVANETAAGVSGVVVGVDADPDVAAALDAWDADRSSPQTANDVASAIAALVDDYRAARPSVANVVIVGDDGLIPFFRVADRTTLSPEASYASAFDGNNELVGALARNYMLTDDPYGASVGVQTNIDELFVPEIAVGRLVETPEDILGALTRFVDFDGRLDGTTAFSALVAGYEFLADGSQAVADGLDANNGATGVDTSLISETWDRQALQNALGGDPDVASVNAHFDHNRLLPADQNAAHTEDDLFEVADLDALGASALQRGVLFSMGCHAGLSVSDVELGVSDRDWAEAFGARGTLFLGNTVYGYGDTELVSLSELLDAYFAQQLTGDMSVGQALMLAKQQYAADMFVLTPYDAKILQGFTLYGLPMFRLDTAAPAPAAPAPAALALEALAAATPLPALATDPITGLGVAPVSFDLTVGGTSGPGTLHDNTTPDGHRYFDVDGETVQAQYRPVQPITSADVSRRDLGTGELVDRAHGVLWTDFTSTDIADFTPLYYLPDPTGHTGDAGDLGPVGDAAFPAAPSRVTTAVAPDGGETQQVLFVPGQFRPDPDTPGVGTQRLFTGAEGVVLYADPAVDDFTPPTVFESHGAIVDTTAAFAVEAGDDAARAFVLFRETGTSDWRGLDLVRTAGTNRWTGGAAVSTNLAEFGVQVADQAGNVAYSFNKTDNFLAAPSTGGTLVIELSAPQPPASGWFTTPPVTATIAGAPEGATVQYSLDGAAFTTYTGPFPITGEGIHFLTVTDSTGNIGTTVIPIDTMGPIATAVATPAPGAVDGWSPGDVTVSVTAIDPGGSGVAGIVWSATGGLTQPETVVPGESAAIIVPAEGETAVTFAAIDSAGNRGPDGTVTVKVDTSGPAASCAAADGLWHAADVSVACTASDAGIGLASESDTAFDLSTSVPEGTETADAQTGTRDVCDALAQCTPAGPVGGHKVDRLAPVITITAPTAVQYTIGQVVNAAFSCSDGGSGVASCTGTVANGAPVDTAAGTHTFSVTAVDNVGNTSTQSVTYSATYAICLQYDPNKAHPRTGTVPIKLKLCDAAGHNLSSASITLTATTIDGSIAPGANFQGNSNYGNVFRFGSGQYMYNLDVGALAVGPHTLFFTVSTAPGLEFAAPFTLK